MKPVYLLILVPVFTLSAVLFSYYGSDDAGEGAGGVRGEGGSSRGAEQSIPSMQTLPGFDTTYRVLKEGAEGADIVKKGDKVTVHATGVVQNTGKKFWSTKDAGQRPFTYSAGTGNVITGWDQGCLGMKVGEVRKLVIPAHEGYGKKGFPAWGIPADATLDFEVGVLSIERT